MEQLTEFQIAEILARKPTDAISEKEQRMLDRWIARSEENRRVYENFIAGESLRERNLRFAHLDPQTMIGDVQRKYGAIRRRRIALRWSAAAAVTVAVAILSVLLLGNDQTNVEGPIFADRQSPVLILDDGTEIMLGDADTTITLGGDAAIVFGEEAPAYEVADENTFIGYNTISVPQGGIYSIRLPDGSLVTINANSKLRYPIPFPKDIRQVWLEGEAFFDVAPNANQPFVVNYKANNLQVLGTKFNVRAYPGKGSTATLAEGSVVCRTPKDSCLLTPGYQAVIAENQTSITVEKADMRSVLAWTREYFSFNDQELKDIMQELGEWYGVKVEFDDPALEQRIFTIEANRSSSINSILDILVEIGKINYKQDGRLLTIYESK